MQLIHIFFDSDPNSPDEIDSKLMDYWKPMTSKRIEYLLMKINGTMETDLYKDAYPFWKRLPIGSTCEVSRNFECPNLFVPDRKRFWSFGFKTSW